MSPISKESFAQARETINMERANAGLDHRPVWEMSGYWFDRYFELVEQFEQERETSELTRDIRIADKGDQDKGNAHP